MTAMTPQEIQNKTFEKKGMGGYKVDEVSAYLADVAAYLRVLQAEKDELEEKLSVLAEKLEEYREDEDSLRTALISAQKLANSVVRDAKNKAEMLLIEASEKAEVLVNGAKANIDREAVALTRIQGQVGEFKSQLLGMYKRHIEMIQAIPDEWELPRDMREIVAQAVVAEPPEPYAAQPEPQQEPEEPEFIIAYEQEPDNGDDGGGEIMQEQQAAKHKLSNFGDLGSYFGDKAKITRND